MYRHLGTSVSAAAKLISSLISTILIKVIQKSRRKWMSMVFISKKMQDFNFIQNSL